MTDESRSEGGGRQDPSARRLFLQVAMGGGLVAGYGTLAAMAARFLYAEGSSEIGWQYVVTVDQLSEGESLTYTAPDGARLVIARQAPGDAAEAFIALSSVCPHLGCQVHWEPHNNRFFCPCHNGAFDRQGNPTEGPPLAARQVLTRFPLKVENGMLFVETPLRALASANDDVVRPAAQTREA